MSRLARTESKPPPPVDERLVAPESRYEAMDGRVEYVAPADEPHGTRHSKLSALLEAHVAAEFEVASDMLTRTSEFDDVAPDASIFDRERDPVTGGRKLEQLAFEVASTERLSHAARKARKLADRGVRRVFVVDVEHARVAEWSRELDDWRFLEHGAKLEDPVLGAPLPVEALARAAWVDDAMASALLAKRNPVLQTALATERDQGKFEGKLESTRANLLAVLAARRLEPSLAERQRFAAERSPEKLALWLVRAVTCRAVAEIFD